MGYIETLDAAINHPHYKAPLAKHQGRGVASGFWFNAGGESSAQLNITEDGNVVVTTGHPDVGGSRASIANITAELLGIHHDKVSVHIGDTASIGYSNLTGGSRVLFASAMVVTESAQIVIKQLKQRAAKIWGIDEDAIEWWLKSAELGYAPCQFSIGAAYLIGSGIEKDLSKAKFWLQKAKDSSFEKYSDSANVLYAIHELDKVKDDMYYNMPTFLLND